MRPEDRQQLETRREKLQRCGKAPGRPGLCSGASMESDPRDHSCSLSRLPVLHRLGCGTAEAGLLPPRPLLQPCSAAHLPARTGASLCAQHLREDSTLSCHHLTSQACLLTGEGQQGLPASPHPLPRTGSIRVTF